MSRRLIYLTSWTSRKNGTFNWYLGIVSTTSTKAFAVSNIFKNHAFKSRDFNVLLLWFVAYILLINFLLMLIFLTYFAFSIILLFGINKVSLQGWNVRQEIVMCNQICRAKGSSSFRISLLTLLLSFSPWSDALSPSWHLQFICSESVSSFWLSSFMWNCVWLHFSWITIRKVKRLKRNSTVKQASWVPKVKTTPPRQFKVRSNSISKFFPKCKFTKTCSNKCSINIKFT